MVAKFLTLSTPYKEDAWPRGVYSVTLVADGDDPEFLEFKAKMEDIHAALRDAAEEQAGKKLKDEDPFCPIAPEVDKDTGEETGRWIVRLKHYDRFIDKKTGKEKPITPRVYDAKAKPLPEDVIERLGWGSTVRCSFQARAWAMKGKVGIAYNLSATQVVLMEERPDASGNDFEDHQTDGFQVDLASAEF
jgi:hypothetical protein